ncbi:dipeptidase [Acidocella aromatica]|uniref:Acetylornithine deacetylase/succinyl-diaminopimelate desuccinylase-like protein n=1 Tax=Acidocella aromatica TaxID=1303579 RepID=A0A840VC10_9PROT|nr:dipeptidase [Acidocella aromatica]MBB5373174.1 acetylornithine deacetylase/succinyl-diaminopimelate desuccinylase-like protein [Acidocella aromatica]
MQKILDTVDAQLETSLERLFAFLRIPSISAQPSHAGDCRKAAEWARDALAGMGFSARLSETSGLPGVIATHHEAGPNAPHVLFYGHYDVQPADPLELWNSDPFDPQLVDGPRGKRIVARGAVDDKGQVVSFMEAVRAHLAVNGKLPVRLTVLLEGEEENGSPSLAELLSNERETLAADFVYVADTNMWDFATPAITTSLRGLAAIEVRLHGPKRDLHSGLFGGIALNPIQALVSILGELKDDTGRIQIPGFYDGITPVSPAQAENWAGLGFDARAFLGDVGLSTPAGEADQLPLAQLWARPTAELNGIYGGYQGEGSKTVIPAHATAKLTFRLVAGQDPEKVLKHFERFVTERLPKDARVEFKRGGAAPGFSLSPDAPFLRAATAALAAEFNKPAALIGSGASIPVVEAFKTHLGLDTLLVGFGLDDDCIHSPNEKFEMACFHRGTRAHARMLTAFAAQP